MQPVNILNKKCEEVDRLIRVLHGPVNKFYGQVDPWNDKVTDEQYYYFSNSHDPYSDYWFDWISCPIRKRQQTIYDIIDAPNGFTIGENAILK